MSNQENSSEERGVRKSKRQRVPNQYYTAGINELKKATQKPGYKKNRQEEDEYSSFDERNNLSSNYKNIQSSNYGLKMDQSGTWLPCTFPDQKTVKVQFVIDFEKQEVLRVKEQPRKKQPQQVPTSIINNTANKKSLLSLLTDAIKDVQQDGSSPVKKPMQELYKVQSAQKVKSVQPPAMISAPKRIRQEDKEGKILGVEVCPEQKILKLVHSKLGTYQLPLEREYRDLKDWNLDEQTTAQKVKQIRKNIAQHSGLLRGIEIFN